MKRIALLALTLTAAFAVSGATASISMAEKCVRVEEPTFGNWTNAACTEKVAGQQKNYIKIQQFVNEYQLGQWCAEIELSEAVMEPKRYETAQCSNLVFFGHFEKVYRFPAWSVNGKQLKQGTKQNKLQLKGTAVLKSVVGGLSVTVECRGGVSEGSTIDGNGLGAGQGKGHITFSSCSSEQCPPNEPIVTKQTKSHLGTISGQNKYGEIFEPTEGEIFTEIKFGKPCSVIAPVKGSVVAEVLPQEAESQEGLLNFPETAIEKINIEGQERTVKLKLGNEAAKFRAAFGQRLASNEPFGVWGSN